MIRVYISLAMRCVCAVIRDVAADGNNELVGTEGQNGVCLLELNPLYAILSSMISFYLPCLAMLCIYYRLHRYARRQVEMIKMTYKSSFGGLSQAGLGGRTDEERDGITSPLRDKVSDHKAAITLGIIMGVFLMSWSPFSLCTLDVGGLRYTWVVWCGSA